VASCHGVNGTALSTTFHVSWNGATDVKYWRFFTQANLTGPSEQIAIIPKKSFETSFAAHGYLNLVSVEALDMNFQVLGQSATVRTQPPVYWPEGVELLKPDDAAAVADEDSASTRKTLTFVGLFVAGFLTSTSVYLILSMYHPTFRRYLRRTYSRVQSEDTDEGVGLLNLNA
jgi:hypothetical protein